MVYFFFYIIFHRWNYVRFSCRVEYLVIFLSAGIRSFSWILYFHITVIYVFLFNSLSFAFIYFFLLLLLIFAAAAVAAAADLFNLRCVCVFFSCRTQRQHIHQNTWAHIFDSIYRYVCVCGMNDICKWISFSTKIRS